MGDSDIGERVKHERKALKITQKDLAKRTGLSGATIGRIERGEVEVKHNQVEVLFSALGISHLPDCDSKKDRLTVPEILDKLEHYVAELRKIMTR